MNLEDFKPRYYPIDITGFTSVKRTLAQDLYDRKQYDIREEHVFMEDSFEMFEMMMKEERKCYNSCAFSSWAV